MVLKIFTGDPRTMRLPKKTGIGGKMKPFNIPPLFNPDFSISNNQRLQASLQQFSVTSPDQVRQATLATLNRMVESANTHMRGSITHKGLSFRVDEDSNRISVTVRDTRTGEVLKTIPSERALELAGRLQDLSGLLVDKDG